VSDHRPLAFGTHDTARLLGVSVGTVRRWADAGLIESYRTPGGHRRFSLEQIDRFLAQLRAHPERDNGQVRT
jgi:excisionase family DNA binding protein